VAQTDNFREFYERVRTALSAFAAKKNYFWFHNWNAAFWVEYENWNRTPRLDKMRGRLSGEKDPLARLIGCAYLHIGYDLPRVLARKRSIERERVVAGPDIIGYDMTNVDVSQLWASFLEADDEIQRVFRDAIRDWRIVGPWAAFRVWFAGHTGRDMRSLSFAPELWLVWMRREAWNNAERIGYGGDAAQEAALLEDLEQQWNEGTEKGTKLKLILKVRPPRLSWPSGRNPLIPEEPRRERLPLIDESATRLLRMMT
jgi:hypothetical protein